MNEPARRKKVRLGDLLVEQKAITAEQLQLALVEQRRTGRRLGRVLADLKLLPEEKVQEVLAEHLQVPFEQAHAVELQQAFRELFPGRELETQAQARCENNGTHACSLSKNRVSRQPAHASRADAASFFH